MCEARIIGNDVWMIMEENIAMACANLMCESWVTTMIFIIIYDKMFS